MVGGDPNAVVLATPATPRVWHLRVHGPMGLVIALIAALGVHDIEVHEPHLEVLKHYYQDEPVS